MVKVYVVTMIGVSPETAPVVGETTASGTVKPSSSQMTSAEVQKIVDTLKSVGKDPATTSLAEAQEICRLLESAKSHEEKSYLKHALIILGIIVVIAVIGMIVLAFSSKPVPDSLIAVGAAALGLLAGILVSSCKGN